MAYTGFDKLKKQLEAKGNSPDKAAAIAAHAGRKKYGKRRFQAAAAAGKKLGK